MKKYTLILFISAIFSICSSNFVNAQESSNFSVEILSPSKIKEYPGNDFVIKAKITNKTDKDIHNVFTYITMANLSKKWTVNLEDYSADAGTDIGTIKAHEERIVKLPITLVYAADYFLYTTVVSKDSAMVTSSDAIPVFILGNTKIAPFHVAVVSAVIPSLLLITWIYTIKRGREKKDISRLKISS